MDALIPTYQGTVMQWHCDHMGHMNVMWYVGKFDEATWNLFAQMGVTSRYLREKGRAMAAVEQRIQYRRELLAGDTLSIASGVLEVRERAFTFFHEMRNNQDGEVAATCRLVGVHMDSTARKAVPFPDAAMERARAFQRPYDFGYRD